jgi:hypothetical protein
MVRQCAWCLYTIDCNGERLSSSPLPKLYEASHGICNVCGAVWITRAMENQTGQEQLNLLDYPDCKERQIIARMQPTIIPLLQTDL